MTYTRRVRVPKRNSLPLPKDFAKRLELRAGQSLIIQLIEEAGLILVIPGAAPARAKSISPKASARAIRKRPRYDRIFDSAREIVTDPAPFASGMIQPEALQALQALPTGENPPSFVSITCSL
ncbi:MAG: hypothetical protein HY741_13360 [Chloroflexi bacterium]|nr:hypothetical protein [Chloroflexota bacterium]